METAWRLPATSAAAVPTTLASEEDEESQLAVTKETQAFVESLSHSVSSLPGEGEHVAEARSFSLSPPAILPLPHTPLQRGLSCTSSKACPVSLTSWASSST